MMTRSTFVSIPALAVVLFVEGSAFRGPDRAWAEGRPDRRRRPTADSAIFQRPPVPKDADEKEILDILKDMHDNQSRGMMNVPPEDGRTLRVLTEAVNAKHVVEIGTSNGYSGIWICLALRKTGGKLTTFDIDERRASLAKENFKRAGVDKMVTIVLGDAHKTITQIKDPIDVVFIDADKEGYGDYLKKLLPLLRPGGLILAHNTTSSAHSMKDYLEAITTNGELETIFLNKEEQGIGVTLKKR